jgi:hypothetical protein
MCHLLEREVGARTEMEAGNRRGISTEKVSGWIDIDYEVEWRSNSVFYNPSKQANELHIRVFMDVVSVQAGPISLSRPPLALGLHDPVSKGIIVIPSVADIVNPSNAEAPGRVHGACRRKKTLPWLSG